MEYTHKKGFKFTVPVIKSVYQAPNNHSFPFPISPNPPTNHALIHNNNLPELTNKQYKTRQVAWMFEHNQLNTGMQQRFINWKNTKFKYTLKTKNKN